MKIYVQKRIVKFFLVLDTDLSDKRITEIKEIEKECTNRNIELITSAPTFEIWYLMHYRDNKLNFSNSKEVKRELEKIINDKYYANTNIFKLVKDSTEKAITTAKSFESQSNKNNKDLLMVNPHSSIYKIIEVINHFKE